IIVLVYILLSRRQGTSHIVRSSVGCWDVANNGNAHCSSVLYLVDVGRVFAWPWPTVWIEKGEAYSRNSFFHLCPQLTRIEVGGNCDLCICGFQWDESTGSKCCGQQTHVQQQKESKWEIS